MLCFHRRLAKALNDKAFSDRNPLIGYPKAEPAGIGCSRAGVLDLAVQLSLGIEERVSMKARVAAVVLLAGLLGSPSADADSSVNVGALSCHVSGGVGFIFGSSKELDCVFKHTDGST